MAIGENSPYRARFGVYTNMELRFFRRTALALTIQATAALLLLRRAYPIYWDGAGPMTSFFYSGHLPSMVEYHSNKWQYDARFLFPYVVAAVLVAVIAVVAPKIAERISRRRIAIFFVAFGLMFAAAAAWDIVVTVSRLNVGVFLSFEPDVILAFASVVVPVALLSAVFVDDGLPTFAERKRS